MGYEIEMYIGRAGNESDEIERDMSKPYEDNSGFAYKRDKDGGYVKTGRKEHYFMVMATIDLCKLGYQDDALNRVIAESFKTAKERADERKYYFYGTDGNTQIEEDWYGAKFWPVPVAKVLAAMKKSWKPGAYRRTDWAMALLGAMIEDREGLEVLFYGH